MFFIKQIADSDWLACESNGIGHGVRRAYRLCSKREDSAVAEAAEIFGCGPLLIETPAQRERRRESAAEQMQESFLNR